MEVHQVMVTKAKYVIYNLSMKTQVWSSRNQQPTISVIERAPVLLQTSKESSFRQWSKKTSSTCVTSPNSVLTHKSLHWNHSQKHFYCLNSKQDMMIYIRKKINDVLKSLQNVEIKSYITYIFLVFRIITPWKIVPFSLSQGFWIAKKDLFYIALRTSQVKHHGSSESM